MLVTKYLIDKDHTNKSNFLKAAGEAIFVKK